jgi:phosphatidylinositol alpha-1,6-mannosyltransferase
VISPDFPPAPGGIQTVVERLARYAEGWQPHVVTLDHPGAAGFDSEQGFSVRRVGGVAGNRPLTVLRLNMAAIAVGRALRPQVVLSAHIVTSPAAWLLRRRRGVPVVQYVYADEVVHRPRLARFAVRSADACVVISEYTRELALALGARPDRLHLIPPGVELPDAQAVGKRAARPTAITVGRLEDRFKGHDMVIRALPLVRERVPDVEWVVVGDGRLRGELDDLAGQAGVREHVRFAGSVSDAERDALLDCAHVFVMPARLPDGGAGGEGFGIVYLEAGAHGLPVVAGAVGGVRDAVDESCGVLVEPTDERAIARAVADLLLDSSRARRLGDAGHERAQRYAWPRIAARVERLLIEVARAR